VCVCQHLEADIESKSASLTSLTSVCESLVSEHASADVVDLQRTVDELKSQLNDVSSNAAKRRHL